MFDDESEKDNVSEDAEDPKVRAKEKADFFRLHAELAAVFEATRKFEAQIIPGLDPELTREVQRKMGKLDKSRKPEHPVLPPEVIEDAASILALPGAKNLSTNDYHLSRRPGEVMIVRWIEGEQIDSFYERFQAHFDAGLDHFRDEQRSTHEWKQDPKTLAYLDALDALDVKMADVYLRAPIRQHGLFVLSTQSADEIDILHLSDHLMGTNPAEIVGEASAPPEDPTEQDRAWFFKLFSLRTFRSGNERMCFFAYLQKTDEAW